ncbi:MAG: gamma-glutamyl-gamma-aminobutyrate hydrolase family protein [Microbacteriaceae bacterium]|nr:gamma-glutamyl-gamma-aminobutyrate hydrolase family protein [Microbacteriaceae bacterium]
MVARRPRIAIVARFAESTSATRYEAIVTARRLAEGVWAAGAEPLTFLAVPGSDWTERLNGIDGVLMPGGADVDPRNYGQDPISDELYGMDMMQDEVDMSLIRHVLLVGLPMLAICRGLQITNVALGGTLTQHMESPHLRHVASVTVDSHAVELGLTDPTLEASCYHHQAIDKLAEGLTVIARAAEGHVEAVKIDSAGWAFGVQWHPEDNYDTERGQLEIFERFISAAS